MALTRGVRETADGDLPEASVLHAGSGNDLMPKYEWGEKEVVHFRRRILDGDVRDV